MKRRSSEISDKSGEPPRKKSSHNCYNNATFSGEIITDLKKKQWRLGKSIGNGGFGDVYLASDDIKETVKLNSKYVAKIEKHSSGPLFVEMNCYIRASKLEMIEKWLKEKQIRQIGMPYYIASGSLIKYSDRYRFLILPRYGNDLDTIFKSKNKRFSLKTIFTTAIQVLDILEYLHSQGYVHCDIKGSNLLLGYNDNEVNDTHDKCKIQKKAKSKRKLLTLRKYSLSSKSTRKKSNTEHQNQIFLLDYGLASRYLKSNGQHKEYCGDVRTAHAGTVLFCSRDAHAGCPSRRSDLENLGYNILYWMAAKLPWEDSIADPDFVNTLKQNAMSNLDTFLTNLLNESYPNSVYEFFDYINRLSFEEQPDYDYCRRLFSDDLLEFGYRNDNILDLDKSVDCDKETGRTAKLKKQSENRRKKLQKDNLFYVCKPLGINSQIINLSKPVLRSEKKINKNPIKNKQFDWAEVLSSNPELLLRTAKDVVRSRKNTESSDTDQSVLNIDLSKLNPTYAMIDVVRRAQKRAESNGNEMNEFVPQKRHNGYTPAMEYYLQKKLQNEKLLKQNRTSSPRMTRNRSKNSTSIQPPIKKIKKTGSTKSSKNLNKITRSIIVSSPRSCSSLRG